MKYYPVFLRVAGRRCVVVGGGAIAARKAESLLAAGAHVAVISPSLSAELAARAARGELEHVARPYQSGDLAGAMLAYAATDDEAVQGAVGREAEVRGVLLNI